MKKVLAIILSLVLMMGTATTAFAASDQYYGTGSMEATAYSYGSCEFGIPATTDFSKMNEAGCTIQILNYDIDTTDSIIVMIENAKSGGGIEMTHNTKEGVTADLYLYRDRSFSELYTNDITDPLWSITYDELEELATPQFTFWGLLDESASAGGYTGTIQFSFQITQG